MNFNVEGDYAESGGEVPIVDQIALKYPEVHVIIRNSDEQVDT